MKIKELENTPLARDPAEVSRIESLCQRWDQVKETVGAYQAHLAKGQIEKVENYQRIEKYVRRNFKPVFTGNKSLPNRDKWAKKAGSGLRGGILNTSPDEQQTIVDIAKESIIGGANDIVSVEYLESAAWASRAVGMINRFGSPWGTGFLVGRNLLMTNNHVIDSIEMTESCELVLNFEDNFVGLIKAPETFSLDAERFFLTNETLDFTIVAVADTSDDGRSLHSFPTITLDGSEGKALIGHHTNVIHHPAGEPKRISFRESEIIFLDTSAQNEKDNLLFYNADTKKGSSGSPVFNDQWDLIALHFQSIPRRNKNGDLMGRNNRLISKKRAEENPDLVAWEANAGIRVSRIVKALGEAELNAEMSLEREQLAANWMQDSKRRHSARANADGNGLTLPPIPLSALTYTDVSADATVVLTIAVHTDEQVDENAMD